MSVLVCENISFQHKQEDIIKGFNFNFLENKVYAVIGKKNTPEKQLY